MGVRGKNKTLIAPCPAAATAAPRALTPLLSGPTHGAFPDVRLPAQLLWRLQASRPPPCCWGPTPGAALDGDSRAGFPVKLAGSCTPRSGAMGTGCPPPAPGQWDADGASKGFARLQTQHHTAGSRRSQLIAAAKPRTAPA